MTGNHLSNNPRVQKEAGTLEAAGFAVEVLGAWSDRTLAERDRELLSRCRYEFTPVLDVSASDPVQRFDRQVARVKTRAARLAYSWLGLSTRRQLGATYGALRRVAFRTPARLYIAHSEVALAVATELRRTGCLVGLDMEDWFSEDLLAEVRSSRPIRLLRGLEGALLAHGGLASCPSAAMSEALAREFGCRPPAIIYNAFPWADRDLLDGRSEDRIEGRRPSIHWYSQTIGPGRGLEDLLAALPLLKHEAEIHLRGYPVAGFAKWLADRTPEGWRNRIFLHDVVSNEELLSRLAEHDIGFAGEMKFCRSRDLTVTNKILQYLLAGLAVVASDTAGQREVAEQSGEAVLIYSSGDPAALAGQLDVLLGDPERLKRARVAALQAAERTFCWERQEPVLLEAVRRALDQPFARAAL